MIDARALQVASTRSGTSARSTSPQAKLARPLVELREMHARGMEPMRARTRLAPRISRLARQTSGQPPFIVTPPGTIVAS